MPDTFSISVRATADRESHTIHHPRRINCVALAGQLIDTRDDIYKWQWQLETGCGTGCARLLDIVGIVGQYNHGRAALIAVIRGAELPECRAKLRIGQHQRGTLG